MSREKLKEEILFILGVVGTLVAIILGVLNIREKWPIEPAPAIATPAPLPPTIETGALPPKRIRKPKPPAPPEKSFFEDPLGWLSRHTDKCSPFPDAPGPKCEPKN